MNNYQMYQLYLKSGFFKNYCYIIFDTATNQAVVIDPAWDLKSIESVLRKVNADLTAILLTHSHFDHVNLVNPLVERYNPQVIMSVREINYYKFRCNNLTSVENGDIFSVGKTDIKCLLTPGHTAGGTCFLLKNHLFTGDTIFTEGCGICTSYGGSPVDMFNSIQMIKNTISSEILVYPAHSFGIEPGHTIDYLFKQNIYFQINNLENFIAFRMRKNQKMFNFN